MEDTKKVVETQTKDINSEKAPETENKTGLPKGVKIVGIYKMKDKKGRDVIAFPINPDVEGIIIQKVKGQSSKIIVAVKLFDQVVDQPIGEKKDDSKKIKS